MSNKLILQEYLSPTIVKAQTLFEDDVDSNGTKTGGKTLYMKGICIQGGVRNANQRVYPVNEIARAVKTLKEQISQNQGVPGEADHPTNLRINLDRISHLITEMDMDGNNGIGKLKIVPTPMGSIIRTLIESGVRLGVSSRGSGNVQESEGTVSDFEIVTVDIVAQPSAPEAYPQAIYEGLLNMNGGLRAFGIATELQGNAQAQKYLKQELSKFINSLK